MESLRATFDQCTDDKPWCSGVCAVPKEDLQLFFGDKSCPRAIDIPNATDAQLEELCEACAPAPFGLDQESVLDETYRKALKLDKDLFALNLSPNRLGIGNSVRTALVRREKDTRDVIFDLYKLNLYGEGSFFKTHKDTPRGENMFGSLVVVLPTKHEGGTLVLRHSDQELKFDSAQLLKEQAEPSIAFIAFYSDVDHEVEVVTAGKRITITYNLYYAPVKCPMVRVGPKGTTLQRCIEELKTYLLNPSVFPKGGYLGFGLYHSYPMDERKDLEVLHLNLKGGDATVYEACEEVGLEVSLRPVYSGEHYEFMSENLIEELGDDAGSLDYIMTKTNSVAIELHHNDRRYDEDETEESDLERYEIEDRPHFEWVTKSSYTGVKLPVTLTFGNDPAVGYLYGKVNMVAYVPEPPKRNDILNLAPSPQGVSEQGASVDPESE